MNRHYDRYLTLKYAPLYRDRYANMQQTAMCWGFECGDGWFNIVNTLSRELCWPWLKAKQKYDLIKDHEGQLFYKAAWGKDAAESDHNYRITAEMIEQRRQSVEAAVLQIPIAVQVKEKFGGLRFYVNGANDKQYELIDFAESLSLTTCEVCGKKGKRNRSGWITTRCKEHRSKNDWD